MNAITHQRLLAIALILIEFQNSDRYILHVDSTLRPWITQIHFYSQQVWRVVPTTQNEIIRLKELGSTLKVFSTERHIVTAVHKNRPLFLDWFLDKAIANRSTCWLSGGVGKREWHVPFSEYLRIATTRRVHRGCAIVDCSADSRSEVSKSCIQCCWFWLFGLPQSWRGNDHPKS